jgi:hypothetical protein
MKTYPAILVVAALFGSSGLAFAQQQYDSLGSPTPAPQQNASPSSPAPNTPKAGDPAGGAAGNSMNDANNRTNAGTKGTSYTTGAGADKMPAGSVDGTINSGSTTPSDPTTNGGATPNGLTPE